MQFSCDYTMWLCLFIFQISTVPLLIANTAIFSMVSIQGNLSAFGCCGVNTWQLAKSTVFALKRLQPIENEG